MLLPTQSVLCLPPMIGIGVWAPSHSARKHALYKRVQIAVKTKTFTILTSNKTLIIPKLQWNPDFSSLQGKRKFGYFEKSGVKLECLIEERETTFVSSYQRVPKNEGSTNRDSTVVILKPRILYDLDRQPSKIRNL